MDSDRTGGRDRRQSDQLLREFERQISDRLNDIASRLSLLETIGSRGHAVLAQAVEDFKLRVSDISRASDKTNSQIEREIQHLRDDVQKLDNLVTASNLDRLPPRVDRLEATIYQTGLDKLPERVGSIEAEVVGRRGAQTGLSTRRATITYVLGGIAGFIMLAGLVLQAATSPIFQ